jgi:hypothetical protein
MSLLDPEDRVLPASDDRYDAQLPAVPGRQQQPSWEQPGGEHLRAVRAVGRRGFGLLAGQGPTAVHDVVDQTQLLIAGEPFGVRSRPDPGPLTRTSTMRSPTSFAFDAAVIDACCAANGVPFRDPRNPSEPALDQEIVLPSASAITYTWPSC